MQTLIRSCFNPKLNKNEPSSRVEDAARSMRRFLPTGIFLAFQGASKKVVDSRR